MDAYIDLAKYVRMRMARTIFLLLVIGFWANLATAQGSGSFAMQHGGLERTYEVFEPNSVATSPRPLLLLLHGRFGTGENTLEYTQIRPIANRLGFIVVAPDGYKKSWNDGRNDTPAHRKNVDDVGFLNALLDQLMKDYSVDPNRVYCAGMSNGGFMTMTLMAQSGKRFAAAAIVTASVPEKGAEKFLPSPPLPLLILNGTSDPLVKYNGGPISNRNQEMILSTPKLAEMYSLHCGCTESQVSQAPNTAEDGTVTEITKWHGCKEGTALELWTVKGGGHTWPGKKQYLGENLIGKTSRDFDGTEVILEFLLRHKRP